MENHRVDGIYKILDRESKLFSRDIEVREKELSETIHESRFLVIGGAGSIGQAVCFEIFKRNPKLLHVIDISENNLVELVRNIRSSLGYIEGEFATFAIDVGSDIFDAFMKNSPKYDYVLNLSALKHVRSEKDPYTLMRMVDVNIFNTDKTIGQAIKKEAKKYFCVSTDKAANPVNMMGASKRIMEMFLMRRSEELPVSTARFANVAFSDGSLLYGFNRRIEKEQPIAAPRDIKRYFLTPQESGELCLLSCIFGQNRDLFFPKLDEKENLISFSDIAVRYLKNLGYEAVECPNEEEARSKVQEYKKQGKWPVYFFDSDTTGEKAYEEFYTTDEKLDIKSFMDIGIIKNDAVYSSTVLNNFEDKIRSLRLQGYWKRNDIISLFLDTIPEFKHQEKNKFLDERM